MGSWRIGSDANISIMEDAWLPGSPSYHIHENINLRGLNAVADYINNDTMIWKAGLIKNTLMRLRTEYCKFFYRKRERGMSWFEERTYLASSQLKSLINYYIKVPPNAQTVKVNFDAAFRQDLNRFAWGLVVRDPQEVVMVTKQKLHDRVAFPFAAEGLACLLAIRLSIQLGLQYVVIEGDVKSIINKNKMRVKDRSEVWAIIDNIHQTKTSFQQLKFAYVPRSANIFAHNLVTKCLRTGKESYLDLGTMNNTGGSLLLRPGELD
ncbi:hypothetical protein J1N35_019174 [Gossypium stocksii]|uniref:RNase H type-1 domain-containing protein n=1 Tax=Gossypium stocksii TaxID=47602 RepID=A0A9D3VRP1_9ROSI|nr:hypothetical protein J1N35_019174 [Gossypium stocksii]